MSDDALDFTLRTVETSAVTFATFDEGQGPVILCLHGFPDSAASWKPLISRWTDAGYRVIAPFMRGYFPSSLARDGNYRMDHLGDDVLRLLDALGIERAHLIGHDWGACAAFLAATTAPQRVDHLVMAAIPPLLAIDHTARALSWRSRAAQLHRSAYMLLFQLDHLAERRVRHADHRYLAALWRRWSPTWAIPSEALDPVREALQGPHLTAALSYYRHTLRSLGNRSLWRQCRQPLEVPTLFVCGRQDGCIGIEFFQDLSHACNAEFDRLILDHAGHFMHAEEPDRFASAVLDFFAKIPGD